ncbi:unnamed protein product [Rhizophagus irregularis]|uniref:Uncharacterized protein n=1 Tax=Rhizophagus irregularis TaxID=588596 RepID=A0A915ZQ07_9GLOM|nr:unnamed protein product [Rhizophagus irregularis]
MDLEKSLEYENLEESLMDKNETFYSEYDENESFDNVEENESLESLFELDFNMLTNAKKLVQQNISEEEDNWEDLSDIGSNFSETESDNERDEIITKVPNNENLTPCVVIDMLDAFQEKILAHLAPILCIINTQEKSETTSSTLLSVRNIKNEVPSLFIILIILILVKFNYNFDKKLNPKNLTSKHFFEFGEALAHSIILAKNELKIHKKLLESPTSIEEYRSIFPSCLVQFYDGLLKTLYETKKKL